MKSSLLKGTLKSSNIKINISTGYFASTVTKTIMKMKTITGRVAHIDQSGEVLCGGAAENLI